MRPKNTEGAREQTKNLSYEKVFSHHIKLTPFFYVMEWLLFYADMSNYNLRPRLEVQKP